MTRTLTARRTAAVASGLVATSLLAVGCSATDDGAGEDTIVVSSFPFGVEEFEEAVVDPFTEETGIEVELETGSNSDRLSQLQVAGDGSGIDVMLISDYYAALGQEDDLFQQVDAAKVPALEKVADFALEDAYLGPAYSYQLNGTLYSTEALSAEEAASWDLYGSDAHAGNLALPDISVTAGQLMISGVGETYGDGPYDIDTALTTLGEWAPGILQFYASSTEVTNLLTQGEIIAADSLSGFATDLVASGEPFAWTPPATGRYMATNRAMIPAGAPNADGAHQFIDYLLSAEGQTASAELVGDLPVNTEATVPDSISAVVGDIAADPVAEGYETLDPAELVPTRAEWVDRFAREVTAG
ncbi:putative spermidine/putrescine transport system substrate-binding protein [Promicromonospora umidemergens]|uniref:ABC transporter substrate-binding protein n=1 Tax=Promicromonospora umidemergens TaxID=629679 RepID=A0ABP8YDZ1_9MICO|nr:extracellular solute-binding protein [Promicromonospora umidemergens]MCP2286857.1 putative spermidine/putrescine transport system substrate-binding protein [Promicromonospora umidemergens]